MTGPERLDIVAAVRSRLDERRRSGAVVGLVPTMGYLHRGHRSLMARARAETDEVLVTIFVNPRQFGPGEDLDAYPRDLDRDVDICRAEGVDVVFAPTVDEMYPPGAATTVVVDGLSEPLEGSARPGHFDGVATIVAKLFGIAAPCRAYFGEKDFQQLTIIRRMVADLSLPVDVVGCETVREADGLALSSRNSYLTPEERRQAPVVKQALDLGARMVESGETDPARVERAMAAHINGADRADIDYVAAVQADTLVTDGPLRGEVRLVAAVRFGRARLIDNIPCLAPG